jgi:hypothetical protein
VLFTSFLVQVALGLTWPLPVVTAVLIILACAALLRVGRFRSARPDDQGDPGRLAVIHALRGGAQPAARMDLDDGVLAARVGGDAVRLHPRAVRLDALGHRRRGLELGLDAGQGSRERGARTTVAHALLDFRIGYVATGVLAFAFLMLGAGVMYESGHVVQSDAGTQFSMQLVELYSRTLGDMDAAHRPRGRRDHDVLDDADGHRRVPARDRPHRLA